MGLLRRGTDDIDVESCLANLDRLAALDRTGLLDAPPAERLDDLTRAAAADLDTPMAFMSLLDARRAFFASSFGAPDDLAAARQNSVEASYCQYVVALDDVLVVNDSQADELVQDHPATTDGGVRAYLGVPLRVDGHCIGSFCVVDVRSRSWSDDDVDRLATLARAALG